jgi:chemotaxis protein MotA
MEYYAVLRVALISFIKGFPPILAVETARRSIPSSSRPTFSEMEKNCKNIPAGAAPPTAPAAAA